MNTSLQISIVIFGLSYKVLLAKKHILGWIFSLTASLLSLAYLLLYMYLPILVCLEISFSTLAIYGLYKHLHATDALTRIDISIICATLIIICCMVTMQLETNTVWYEVVGSVAYLVGMVLLAQKYSTAQIFGWVCFVTASLCMAEIVFIKGRYILLFVDIVSAIISAYGIVKVFKKRKQPTG